MILLRQTNPEFPQEIRRYGCRFMSMIAIPQLYWHRPLIHSQVMAIFRMGKTDPNIIGENCRTGKDEHLLIDHAFRLLDHPAMHCRQVGRKKGDNDVFWNSRQPYQYMVCRWATIGPDGHWTLFDHDGLEIYDPWDSCEAVGIVGIEDRYVIRKREVDKRLLYRVWNNSAVGG